MSIANSVDVDQTAPRKRKTGRDLTLGLYNPSWLRRSGAGYMAFREIFCAYNENENGKQCRC